MEEAVNYVYPAITFIVGVFGMYLSYKKGKIDLKKMQKEEFLREHVTEETINIVQKLTEVTNINSNIIKKHQEKIDESEKERKLLLKALLNIMLSLKDHGINGKTTQSIKDINEYLFNK